VAVAALRSSGLRRVQPVGHSEVLRLLSKRNTDIGDQRTRVVCRLHALLAELAGGGIAKEMYASDVERFLADHKPETAVEQIRFDLAGELLSDLRRLDEQLKASHKRIREAMRASGSHALYMAAVSKLRQPHSEGLAYFDRKVAEGKTPSRIFPATNTQLMWSLLTLGKR